MLKPLKTHWITKVYVFALSHFSIKQLTVLGFSLVALPLVASLIFSALEVQKLSEKNSNAIFRAAEIEKANKDLQQIRVKMERFASQYIVLKDENLYLSFMAEFERLTEVNQFFLQSNNSTELQALAKAITNKSADIKQYIENNKTTLSLHKIEQAFIELAHYQAQINLLSSQDIAAQAEILKQETKEISDNLLLGLWIIPFVIVISMIFIMLITSPLKRLTGKIKLLEQGQSQKSIHIKGSEEIVEIANALELMRARLHKLELQKSSFIRHISHELKTPLAAIREGSELLYDNSVGTLNSAQTEISEIIRESVNKLQKLIEDLLEFNVVLDSTSLQDNEKIKVNDIIEQAIADRQLDIKRKDLEIKINDVAITTFSNAKQLHVIIDNLLSNAIKYSPNAGTITLDLTLNSDSFDLAITDQGIGIKPEIQSKIFEAFYQGPPPQDALVKSSGLGLTIVKELVMRLNGEISVASQLNEPNGTTFYLSFPLITKQTLVEQV